MLAARPEWQKALLAKSDYFRSGSNSVGQADIAATTAPCPKCRQDVVCAFVYDNGSSPEYYYSHSTHVCLNPECDYREERDAHQGIDQEWAPELHCGICGR